MRKCFLFGLLILLVSSVSYAGVDLGGDNLGDHIVLIPLNFQGLYAVIRATSVSLANGTVIDDNGMVLMGTLDLCNESLSRSYGICAGTTIIHGFMAIEGSCTVTNNGTTPTLFLRTSNLANTAAIMLRNTNSTVNLEQGIYANFGNFTSSASISYIRHGNKYIDIAITPLFDGVRKDIVVVSTSVYVYSDIITTGSVTTTIVNVSSGINMPGGQFVSSVTFPSDTLFKQYYVTFSTPIVNLSKYIVLQTSYTITKITAYSEVAPTGANMTITVTTGTLKGTVLGTLTIVNGTIQSNTLSPNQYIAKDTPVTILVTGIGSTIGGFNTNINVKYSELVGQ